MNAASELPVLTVPDAASWRRWLDSHEDDLKGVWLVLAKKGVTKPTSLTYALALDEALCSGWIDGQVKSANEFVYHQRFTPRRPRSLWSARNVRHVARLTEEARMRQRGLAEVDRAKADGRWARAYEGAADIAIPVELVEEFARFPLARQRFDALSGQNRYAILHRITVAKKPETRRRNAAKYVAMLEQGETPYP